MQAFTIKDLEKLSGIKAHTIRIWEQRYSFLKPRRTETNIRYYSGQELKTVLNISLLHRYGFKISHIDRMNEQELQERIVSLPGADAQHEKIVNELIHFMIDLDMDQFEQLLDQCIAIKGIDKTILQIIFPFLNRIGILWQTNHINATQEHLVTNIIRQKMIVGIERNSSGVIHPKTVLLFLPEGEHHELGLLYVYYLLKNRGIRVLYLGADTPLNDLEFICKFKSPDHLYTHLTCIPGNFNLERFLAQACQRIPSIPITISGAVARAHIRKIPPTIHFKKSIPEVLEYIAGI